MVKQKRRTIRIVAYLRIIPSDDIRPSLLTVFVTGIEINEFCWDSSPFKYRREAQESHGQKEKEEGWYK